MEATSIIYNEKNRIWSAEDRSLLYDYNASMGQLIFNNMKNWPKNVCQISDDDSVSMTFEQALAWAIRIAQYLKKRGLDHTDIIGIVAKNTTYLMPLGVGCLFNTTPFHAINPALEQDTIKHVFGLTKPSLIFCDAENYEKIRAATIEWHPDFYTVHGTIENVPKIEQLLASTNNDILFRPVPLVKGGAQTVAILCSSGTTGLPKAVSLSNSFLMPTGVFNMVNSESVVYISSGLDWATGLYAFICSALMGCTRIITNKPFTPEYFVQLVKQYKISYTVLAPMYLNSLNSCPDATPEALASLRYLTYAGGVASVTTLQRAQSLCKNAMLNSVYGVTEIGVAVNNYGMSNISSIGMPAPGMKIRIVDDDGNNLTYNQVGELFVSTGLAWNGYYGNPEETQRMQDTEGWFHTGDLCYVDNENYLYIVDRKKEILKYQGMHYWPTEIENAISELPQVQDVCVVGIYDESKGDLAGALVVKHKDYEISAEEIKEHVLKRLIAVEKQLHAGVKFCNKLPSNTNAKVMRKVARELFVSLNGSQK